MLTKFKVSNFKNFKNEFILDLTDTRMYEFNTECVKDGIVNKALIYGQNGAGKSNLGYAIFDLISHLTTKHSAKENYTHYLNAASYRTVANFEYDFMFDDSLVKYKYSKESHDKLVYESLSINSVEYLSIDRSKSTNATINLDGTETLKTEMGDSLISLVNYIKSNAVLDDNHVNNIFYKFLAFIEGMLFFRSLDSNNYIGLKEGSSGIAADIIEQDNVKDFEEFLNEAGIECKLKAIQNDKENGLYFKFNKQYIPFYEIASTGTKSLSVFYYWLQRFKKDLDVTFIFIDEFDAFYHHDLSAALIRRLRKISSQIILTTHNTNIMSNDLLRPDCNFIMDTKNIHSLPNCTDKDIRSAHNIEKMYRAGAFNG